MIGRQRDRGEACKFEHSTERERQWSNSNKRRRKQDEKIVMKTQRAKNVESEQIELDSFAVDILEDEVDRNNIHVEHQRTIESMAMKGLTLTMAMILRSVNSL